MKYAGINKWFYENVRPSYHKASSYSAVTKIKYNPGPQNLSGVQYKLVNYGSNTSYKNF